MDRLEAMTIGRPPRCALAPVRSARDLSCRTVSQRIPATTHAVAANERGPSASPTRKALSTARRTRSCHSGDSPWRRPGNSGPWIAGSQ
jgi:hypothetical protein